VATSQASPGHRIRPINGPDWADIGRFAKKALELTKNSACDTGIFHMNP
jgi:hypothetical protein